MAINNYNLKRAAELTEEFVTHLQEERVEPILSKADEIYLPQIRQDPRVVELKRRIKQQKQMEKDRKKVSQEKYNALYDKLYGQILQIKANDFKGQKTNYAPLYSAISTSELKPKDKQTLRQELTQVIANLPSMDSIRAHEIILSAQNDIAELEMQLANVSSIKEVNKLSNIVANLSNIWAKLMIEKQLSKKSKPGLKTELGKLLHKISREIRKKQEILIANEQKKQQDLINNDIVALDELQLSDFATFEDFRKVLNTREEAIRSQVNKALHKQIESVYKQGYNAGAEYFFPEKELEIPIAEIRHENHVFSFGLYGTHSKLIVNINGSDFVYPLEEPIEKLMDLNNRKGTVRIRINPLSMSFFFQSQSDLDKVLIGVEKPTMAIPWDNIVFTTNTIKIMIPHGSTLLISANCNQSYNAIKSHLAATLPQIRVQAIGHGRYALVEPIKLDDAVQIIKRSADADAMYSQAKADFDRWFRRPTFDIAMAFARSEIAQEYLLKRLSLRKQKYIETLIKKQHRGYKLIPAMESLSHTDSTSSEEAFIFTLPSSNPNYVYLVYENLNVARATIVCKVDKQEYEYCLKVLYNHMADDSYINKRQELQWHPRKLCRGMISIKSVNHIDSIFSWSHNLY